MPFKDLEHEGNEIYKSSQRQDVKDAKAQKLIDSLKSAEQRREIAQERYLHPSNPVLWSGTDIDDG